MRTSRAAARLREAPVAPCPSCGPESRTVQGACADCWAPKDGRTLGTLAFLVKALT